MTFAVSTAATLIPLTMFLTIARHINVVVPTILYKVDWMPACVVSTAMISPFLGVTGRHTQIERLVHDLPNRLNNHWLGINQLWLRKTTNIQAAIKARLAYRNRHTHIRSMAGAHNQH